MPINNPGWYVNPNPLLPHGADAQNGAVYGWGVALNGGGNQADAQNAAYQGIEQEPQDVPGPDPQHQNYINLLFQEAQAKKMYGKPKAKVNLPSSLTCEEYQDLVNQTAKLEGSIRLESEELERVLETISTQVEVVRDIGSTIRTHISSLQKAAIQLEKWRLSMPQPSSPGSETGLTGGRSAPAGAGQFAQVGQVEVAPGLLLQDQE